MAALAASTGDWSATTALTSLDGWLYALRADSLWRIDTGDGSFVSLATMGLSGLGATDASLFATDGTVIQETDPSSGFTGELPIGSWTDINAIAARNGHVYVRADNGLWEIEPETGASEALDGSARDLTAQLAVLAPPD